jgi:WD40 repeat protein
MCLFYSLILQTVCLFDWNSGTMSKRLKGHGSSVNRVQMAVQIIDVYQVCSAKGCVWSGSRNRQVSKWNLSSSSMEMQYEGNTLGVTGLCCNDGRALPFQANAEDATKLASGSRDANIFLWDSSRPNHLNTSFIAQNVVTYMVWIPREDCFLQVVLLVAPLTSRPARTCRCACGM